MKFKIDENLPVDLSELLNENNFDSKTVIEQKLQGAKDSLVLEICRKEERILVTLDTDFADITTYPPEANRGIIVIRLKSQSKRQITNTFNKVLPLLEKNIRGLVYTFDKKLDSRGLCS